MIHVGDIISTSGGRFSSSKGFHDPCGGDTMSTLGVFSAWEGYRGSCGGISLIHWGMFSTSGFF